MKKLAYLLALMSGLALAAGSTVNPTIPVANSPLQSAPIRGNFAATASDINSLIQINALKSAITGIGASGIIFSPTVGDVTYPVPGDLLAPSRTYAISTTYEDDAPQTANPTGPITISGTPIAASGYGGHVQYLDDTATLRWQAGLTGATGATSYSVYDVVNSAYAISFNATTDNTLVGTVTDNGTDKLQVNGTINASGAIKTNGGALSLTSGKTLAASNTLTLAGTDSTTMTFPSTSASIARTDAGQTFSGAQVFSGSVTTSVTITNYALTTGLAQAWTTGDVVEVSCMGG